MKKKIVSSLLLVSILLGSTVGVNAATDISNQAGTSTSAEVDSNFSILPSDLSGLVISIPSNLDLNYDESDMFFKVTDSVSAKGDLAENCMLDISVADFITYNNGEGNHYDAEASFKRFETLGNFQYWLPNELLAAKTTPDNRDITIKIAQTDVKNAGDYRGRVLFDISIQKYWNKDVLSSQGYYPIDFSYSNNLGTFALGYRSESSSFIDNTMIEAIVSQSSEGTFEFPKYAKDSDGKCYVLSKIYSNLLTSNEYLKIVDIPNSIIEIGDYAFKNCNNLTQVTIPNSVKTLGRDAFAGCTSLENIKLPDSITYMGNYYSGGIFSGCTALKSVNIPKNITTIRSSIFKDCTSLENIKIPSKVTEIEGGAFYGCTSLTSIELPYSCLIISNTTFQNCTALTDITYKGSIADAKKIKLNGTKLGDIDWSTISDTTSSSYILGHATWHCEDGDFIPANN